MHRQTGLIHQKKLIGMTLVLMPLESKSVISFIEKQCYFSYYRVGIYENS